MQAMAKELRQVHEDHSEEIKCITRRHEQEEGSLKGQIRDLQKCLEGRSHVPDSRDSPEKQDRSNGTMLALQSRVHELEEANMALENAILQQCEGIPTVVGVHNMQGVGHKELLCALEQRDVELQALRGQLQIAKDTAAVRTIDSCLKTTKFMCTARQQTHL
jgi:hypothetical protein